MAQTFTACRAEAYLQKACELTEAASHVFRDESRRLHMLDLAATYQRAAHTLSPAESAAPERAVQQKIFCRG